MANKEIVIEPEHISADISHLFDFIPEDDAPQDHFKITPEQFKIINEMEVPKERVSKYESKNAECNVCGEIMKLCRFHPQRVNEEDMDRIYDKLTQNNEFRVSCDNNDYAIVVRSDYHENDISHFFEATNFKNAISEVPDKDFWIRMDYDTISKNPDNSLTVTVAMTHVIHFRSEGDFLKTIIECLEHALENDYFCVHELTIYPYCIL